MRSVRDTQFINAFKDKFSRDELAHKKYLLKEIQNHQNPLFHLMNIDKLQNRQNALVKELIVLTASLIEISEQQVLSDTFYHPSRETLTYSILFDESLNSLPIYAQVINYLNSQWKKWKSEGVRANDVWTWKGYTTEQKVICHKMWTLAIRAVGEQQQFAVIFDATHRDMKAKLEKTEKIVACLDAYCQQASDKNTYHAMIQEYHDRFERDFVQSIQIPKLLQDIFQFAEKLNPYANVHSWRVFLNQRTTIKGKIEKIFFAHVLKLFYF
jgi:hypothetical protein